MTMVFGARTRMMWGAFFAAVLLHLFFLSVFSVTMGGKPRDYRSALSFLGSILGGQEFSPEASSVSDVSSADILAPSPQIGALQMDVWKLGSIVDKPEGISERYGPSKPGPSKFLTERVSILEDPGDVGIPDAPKVILRMPRQ